MKNKKAQFSVFILVNILSLILGITVTLLWLYDISTKECKFNSECGDRKYCGGDHACHVISVIQESSKVDIVQKNYGFAGFIIGISIIISSLIIVYVKNV